MVRNTILARKAWQVHTPLFVSSTSHIGLSPSYLYFIFFDEEEEGIHLHPSTRALQGPGKPSHPSLLVTDLF